MLGGVIQDEKEQRDAIDKAVEAGASPRHLAGMYNTLTTHLLSAAIQKYLKELIAGVDFDSAQYDSLRVTEVKPSEATTSFLRPPYFPYEDIAHKVGDEWRLETPEKQAIFESRKRIWEHVQNEHLSKPPLATMVELLDYSWHKDAQPRFATLNCLHPEHPKNPFNALNKLRDFAVQANADLTREGVASVRAASELSRRLEAQISQQEEGLCKVMAGLLDSRAEQLKALCAEGQPPEASQKYLEKATETAAQAGNQMAQHIVSLPATKVR